MGCLAGALPGVCPVQELLVPARPISAAPPATGPAQPSGMASLPAAVHLAAALLASCLVGTIVLVGMRYATWLERTNVARVAPTWIEQKRNGDAWAQAAFQTPG